MNSLPHTLFFAILLVFNMYNFLGAAIGIGMLNEIAIVTPKMYWIIMFPMGLVGTYIFGIITWFGIKDIIREIKYNG